MTLNKPIHLYMILYIKDIVAETQQQTTKSQTSYVLSMRIPSIRRPLPVFQIMKPQPHHHPLAHTPAIVQIRLGFYHHCLVLDWHNLF